MTLPMHSSPVNIVADLRGIEKHPGAINLSLFPSPLSVFSLSCESEDESRMEWIQNYDPLGSAIWSPAAAGLPIVVLLGLLVWGVPAPRAALAGLATAYTVATMLPTIC